MMLFKINKTFGHLKDSQPEQFVLAENLEALNSFFEDDPHLELTSVNILDRDIKII